MCHRDVQREIERKGNVFDFHGGDRFSRSGSGKVFIGVLGDENAAVIFGTETSPLVFLSGGLSHFRDRRRFGIRFTIEGERQ